MLNQLKIRTRLNLAFGFLLCLMLGMALAGYWGVSSIYGAARGVLSGEAKMAESSADAANATVDLRRFEKDAFLNLSSADKMAEYLTKWDAEYARLVTNLDDMDRLALSNEEHATIQTMRADQL